MRILDFTEFQARGPQLLPPDAFDPCLLQGEGASFLLLRVPPGLPAPFLEELEALAALMALRANQARAVEAGLESMSADEVEAVFRSYRRQAAAEEAGQGGAP